MTKEQRDELAEKLLQRIGEKNDPWNSYEVKQAFLEIYSAGVQDGIMKLAEAQKRIWENKAPSGAI